MKNILINNRNFVIALTAIMTTAFSTPAIANNEKDSTPADLKYKGIDITHLFNLNTDKVNNGNSRFEISGKKINSCVVYLDLSWYKPQPPKDINPYDIIQLDFSWFIPSKPMNINPYSE